MLSSRKGIWVALAVASLTVNARAAENDKYVPADAELLVHVNVKQILGSPLAKKLLLPQIEKGIKDNKQLQQILTLLGLDPLKDINGLTISNAGQTGDKVLIVVHGKFNADKINTTAEAVAQGKKDDFKITKIGGKNVYETAAKDRTVYSTLISEGSLLVSTNKDYIEAALAGKTGKINQALKSVVGGVDAKQSIWLAALVTDEIRKAMGKQDGPGAAIAPKLKAVTGGVNITDNVAVAMQVQTADAKTAKELRELGENAKGFLAIIGQNEEIKPFVDELMKTLKISAEKTDVNVSFKFSADVVEKAAQKIPQK